MSGNELQNNSLPETITLTTRKADKPRFTLLCTAGLALIVVIGLGIGWAAGGMLASALRNAIQPYEPLQDSPEPQNEPHGTLSAPPEITDREPEPPAVEKKDVPLEEQIRQEALEEIHKKIEEANREFEKRGNRDGKGRKKKKGDGKENEDGIEEPEPILSRKPLRFNSRVERSLNHTDQSTTIAGNISSWILPRMYEEDLQRQGVFSRLQPMDASSAKS